MKKFIYSSLILGSALALASCSADEPGVVKNDGPVSLTVQLPSELATRFANGKSVDILYYTILSADGTTVLAYGDQPWEKDATSATVALDLIPTQNYQVVFFAMNSKATGYGYDAEKAAFTVNYDDMAINDDNYDAFCAKVPDINTDYDTTVNPINLSRPFAQINIGTNDLGSSMVTSFGLENFKTTFTLDADYLATGVSFITSGSNNMTYSAATEGISKEITGLTATAALTDQFPVDGYQYLDMLYLLVNPGNDPDGQALLKGSFSTALTSGDQVQNIELPSLPAKANYQTNVYGKLLTSSKDFTVAIAPAFGGTLLANAVADAAEAVAALNNNSSLVFNGTTDALDLTTLTNTKPVEITLASGASVGSIKVGSNRSLAETAPVTIKVAKDVKFPAIVPTTGVPVYNLTIAGDPSASVENASKGISFYQINVGEIRNVTFTGIHFDGNGINTQYTGGPSGALGTVSDVTIENCVFTNLINCAYSTQQHTGAQCVNANYTIRNNTITYATSGVKSDANAINIADATPGYFIIEKNTITGPAYHGITLAFIGNWQYSTLEAMNASSVTISGNNVISCGHDAIKVGYPCGITKIFNNSVTPGEYGIRVARFNITGIPTIDIYNNKVDMSKSKLKDEDEIFGGITVTALKAPGSLILNVYDNIKNGGDPIDWFQLIELDPEAGSNYATPFSN